MSKRFLSQIQSTVATGTAPLIVASTTAVTNLNADLLDGQHGSYFAPIASPTFTGVPLSTTAAVDTNTTQVATTAFVVGQASATAPVMNGIAAVGTSLRYARTDHIHASDTSRAPLASPTFTGTLTAPTVLLTTADTATTASHYIVETASDGIIRPKTLANTRTEIVTTGAVNAAAATTVGTVTSGIWNAGAVTSSGVVQGTTLTSTIAIGTAPLTVTSTTKVVNLNADLFDDINSDKFVYGTTQAGSRGASVTQNFTDMAHWKSGFWEVNGASWTPDTNWWWGMTMAHTSAGSAYLYGAQLTAGIGTTDGLYFRTTNGGPSPSATAWNRIAFLASPTFTGVPAAPTATAETDTTQIATTAFVQTAVKTTTINTLTASYSLLLADAGEIIEMNVASANTLTVPLNSSQAFPIGTSIDIIQYGAGQTTIVATGGVTIRSNGNKLKLTGQYSAATLYKRGTDEWVVMGDLSA